MIYHYMLNLLMCANKIGKKKSTALEAANSNTLTASWQQHHIHFIIIKTNKMSECKRLSRKAEFEVMPSLFFGLIFAGCKDTSYCMLRMKTDYWKTHAQLTCTHMHWSNYQNLFFLLFYLIFPVIWLFCICRSYWLSQFTSKKNISHKY